LHFIVRTEKKEKKLVRAYDEIRVYVGNSYHYSLVFAQEYLRQPIFFCWEFSPNFRLTEVFLAAKKMREYSYWGSPLPTFKSDRHKNTVVLNLAFFTTLVLN